MIFVKIGLVASASTKETTALARLPPKLDAPHQDCLDEVSQSDAASSHSSQPSTLGNSPGTSKHRTLELEPSPEQVEVKTVPRAHPRAPKSVEKLRAELDQVKIERDREILARKAMEQEVARLKKAVHVKQQKLARIYDALQTVIEGAPSNDSYT
jgi:hypothetical protein